MLTLQTLPACDGPIDDGAGKAAVFPVHAGIAARVDERKKLERLCRYVEPQIEDWSVVSPNDII